MERFWITAAAGHHCRRFWRSSNSASFARAAYSVHLGRRIATDHQRINGGIPKYAQRFAAATE